MSLDETAVAALSAFSPAVTEAFCPDGHVITESSDRRLLWQLARRLLSLPVTLEEGRSVAVYLAATCQHHWHEIPATEVRPAFRRCLWCVHIEWSDQS